MLPTTGVTPSGPAGVPTLSGDTTAGSTLTCSIGTWAEDIAPSLTWRAPASFAYQWTLNGTQLADETGPKLTRTAAGSYTCAAIAANLGGSTTQTSAAHSVLATLTVAATGPGTVAGGGVSCPGTCTASVAGTAVTLRATPSANATFTGWSGACSGTEPCTVTVDRDTHVSATFAAKAQPSTAPDTKLSTSKISGKHRTATFTFHATGTATGFACALVKGHATAKFATCTSPKTYRHLTPAKYTFEVRAIGRGGTDSTPAVKQFTIHR